MPKLTDIKKRFKDYQRANRFKVIINGQEFDEDLEIAVKTASTPTATNGVVIFTHRGRQIKYAGDRTYATFTMTVVDDLEHKYRRLFENWNENISEAGATAAVVGVDADVTIIVQALDRDDVVTMEWTLFGAKVSELGEITWAQDSNDTIAEYSVVLDYDYHEVTA